jgi:hypothetical protein
MKSAARAMTSYGFRFIMKRRPMFMFPFVDRDCV